MQAEGSSSPPKKPTLPEVVVRILRHELGDLLQTVYATAAILQERLPPDWDLERRIVRDLRSRGEGCRNFMDVVHDLVCPVLLNLEPVDLMDTATSLVAQAGVRSPQIAFHVDGQAAPSIIGDPRRISQVGSLLLAQPLERMPKNVWFSTQPGPGSGEVEWIVQDDGMPLTDEQLERLFNPFSSTRHSSGTLALALAHKLVELHHGSLTADNPVEGGFRVRVVWLPAPPSENPTANA